MSGNSANNSNAKTAMELWKMGKPMDEAIAIFGAVRGASKLKRTAENEARVTADFGKANFQKAGINADAAFDTLMPLQAALGANAHIQAAMTNRVLDRLRSGQLVAFGFPVHDPKATLPEAVPPFLFNAAFAKWGKRSFVGHGRTYAEVTVSEFSLPPAQMAVPKRVGRPSFEDDLETVALALTERGEAVDGPPWKAISNAVREVGRALGLPNFSEEKPSNETVRRFIERRNASKS